MAKQVFLFLAISLCTIGRAATYYVSSSGGNDSNDGLSTGSAWQTLKKVNTFRGFLPGDKILLKAGDRFESNLSVYNSGMADKPIVVGRYGTGANPLIYGDHPNAVWTPVSGHPGIYSTPGGSNVARVYDSINYYKKISVGSFTKDAWLDTFVDYNWGWYSDNRLYLRANGDAPKGMHLFEFGIVRTYSANYIIFENIDVRNGWIGFFIPSDHVVVRNCSAKDMPLQGIELQGADSCEVYNNVVDRTAETSIYLKRTTNSQVHHNTVSNTVSTLLGFTIVPPIKPERCGIGLEAGANNLIERNSLSYLEGGVFDFYYEANTVLRYNYSYHTGTGAIPHGTGIQMYSNVFNLDGGTGIGGAYVYDTGRNVHATQTPIKVYNNTVYNFRNYGLYSSTDSVIFRNNIVLTNSNVASFVIFHPNTNSDYNCFYFSTPSTRGWRWGVARSQATYTTLAAYQSATGQDVHSLYADPQFVSSNPLSPDDFKLSVSSPCIREGQNLTSAGLISQNYTDFRGVFVPQDSAPDIGAYQFSSTIPKQ